MEKIVSQVQIALCATPLNNKACDDGDANFLFLLPSKNYFQQAGNAKCQYGCAGNYASNPYILHSSGFS